MNKERLLELADVLEKGYHKFNGITSGFFIGTWFSNDSQIVKDFNTGAISSIPLPPVPEAFKCNSVACIAGFACLLFAYKRVTERDDVALGLFSFEDEAMRLLGLTWEQASYLFTGYTDSRVNGPMAAKVIRHFVETGVVDWGPTILAITDAIKAKQEVQL